jgi:hypothetical protein
VSEHRAWLGLGDPDEKPAVDELMLGQARSIGPRPHTLSRLLTAARAAFFLDSIETGAPELLLTTAAVAGRLGANDAHDCYRSCRLEGVDPPAALVAGLRDLVLDLPAYRPGGWWTAAAAEAATERMPA